MEGDVCALDIPVGREKREFPERFRPFDAHCEPRRKFANFLQNFAVTILIGEVLLLVHNYLGKKIHIRSIPSKLLNLFLSNFSSRIKIT